MLQRLTFECVVRQEIFPRFPARFCLPLSLDVARSSGRVSGIGRDSFDIVIGSWAAKRRVVLQSLQDLFAGCEDGLL
jgi:hypothetical protein